MRVEDNRLRYKEEQGESQTEGQRELNDIRKNEIIRFIMLDGLLYIILQFMVFGIIVFKMFEYNISESKSEYKQSEKQTNEIINLLKKIAGEEKINTGNYEECKKFNENMAKK